MCKKNDELGSKIEFHILSPVAGEPVDPVGVADGLQGVDQQRRALFLQVDDPFVVAAHQPFPAPAQPNHVFHRVVRRVTVIHGLPAFVDGLSGGSAHVQEENHGHLAPVPLPPSWQTAGTSWVSASNWHFVVSPARPLSCAKQPRSSCRTRLCHPDSGVRWSRKLIKSILRWS